MLNCKSNFFARFCRDEGGTLIVFTVMIFVLMLMMGGFIVDLMRYETTRTKLWNALDRSVLAAAALSQKQDREAVVRDYMKKSGFATGLKSVTITASQDSSVVNAVGVVDTHPIFLHMLGIEKFDAVGRSQAVQSITNLEIVLVLDVSDSMSGTKIANLKIAASQFVDTILASDPNHRVTIAIVPYNSQVNLGADMVSKFNITHPNGVTDVNCVEIPASGFNSLALSQLAPMPMMAYADIAYNTNKINGFVAPTDTIYAKPDYTYATCQPTTVNVVRLPNNDGPTLKNQINALQAGGNTSITLGMKWGVTMLDPSMRTPYAQLIADGKIPAQAVNRPFAYDDANSMKIIILMTDGEHVLHARVLNTYKTGLSPIFKSTGDGNYSVRFTTGRPAVAGTHEYYVPHLNTWQAAAWNSGAGFVQQDWKNVWANLKLTYVAWQFYARALGTDSSTRNTVYNITVNAMRGTYASEPEMDDSLNQTCTLAKQNKVIVFGLAVDAPANGQAVIAACASSQAHYFEATPEGIVNAFQTIAGNITMLKLTQ